MNKKEKIIKTPEEAIEVIKSNMPTSGYQMLRESLDMAISALKEIQQYREIGTVEECREAVENKEKVIEQIKVLSAGIILNTNICDDYAEGYVRAAKDIIELVEKGGIE